MKTCIFSLRAAAACLSVLFLCLGCSQAVGNWKILHEDSYGSFSYDAGSIKQTPDNVVTVWAKSNGARYLYEIDCRNKRARILQELDTVVPSPQWFAIAASSGDELLYGVVCPQR